MFRKGIVLTVITLGLTLGLVGCTGGTSKESTSRTCADFKAIVKKYSKLQAGWSATETGRLVLDYAYSEAPAGCFPLETVLKAKSDIVEYQRGQSW
jgi:hypothetical protein